MRPQDGADKAESPFADLLDSCTISDAGPAESTSTAAEGAPAGTGQAETKPQTEKPAQAEIVQSNTDSDDAEEISAELMLLLALGGQPVSQGKEEEKTAVDTVPGGTGVPESKVDADGPQAEGDPSQTTNTDAIQPAPAPAIVAVAAPLPVAAEAAAQPISAPESAEVAATPAVDVSGQAGIDESDVEKASRSTEAIEATLSAQADKNKTAQVEKPTSTAAEQTLKTPAAFRSAASTKELPHSEAPKVDTSEEVALAPAKDTAAAPKTPHGDIETADAKVKVAGPQPGSDPATNAPVVSASPTPPPQASTHQVVPTAPVQSDSTPIHVPVSGLAVEIAAHAQAGKNRFEIRLDPPELGRIDVSLDVGSDGQVTSHLRVERAETLDLLRRDAPMLERALQQAGLKTSDSGLQFSLRDQSFSWQQQQGREMPEMARLVVPDEALPPVDAQRQYGRLAGLGSGVDIRV